MSDGSGPGHTQAGELLTELLLHHIAPLIQGKPSDVIIEAMAAAMMAGLMAGYPARASRVTILRRYARAIDDLADRMP
jgi:hypothetical protein